MSLESFSPLQRRGIEEYVIRKVTEALTQHESIQHRYQPPTTFGTDSSDAKPDTPTTQPSTQVTVTTELSNLVQPLGEVLEELASLISILTKYRNRLQFAYTNVPVGSPGPPVAES